MDASMYDIGGPHNVSQFSQNIEEIGAPSAYTY